MKRYLYLMIFSTICLSCTKNNINRKIIQMDDVIQQMKDNNIKNELLFKERTPSQINENEIRIVDSFLVDEVERFNMKQRESERTINDLIDIENYQCNYIPTLNEKGEKIIHVIAKMAVSDDIWWEVYEIMNVRDGYITVFWLSLNLSEKRGGNIWPNGEG
jgi:hypothetical protein